MISDATPTSSAHDGTASVKKKRTIEKKKNKKSKKLFRLNLSGIFCLKKLHALLHGESLFQALLKTNKVIYCYEAIMRMWAEKSEHTNTKEKNPTKSETTKQSQLLIPDVFCSTHFNLKG